MKNYKLHEAMFEDDGEAGKGRKYDIVACGCCTDEMIGLDDELKGDDKDYCMNGPAYCTPEDGDGWSPCDISGKGDVKKINVCVTDPTDGGTSETKCVDVFDDIFSDPSYIIDCGACD